MRRRKNRELIGVERTQCRALVDRLASVDLPYEAAVICVAKWLKSRQIAISEANLRRAFE